MIVMTIDKHCPNSDAAMQNSVDNDQIDKMVAELGNTAIAVNQITQEEAPPIPSHLEAYDARLRSIIEAMDPETKFVLEIAERQTQVNTWGIRQFNSLARVSAESWNKLLQEYADKFPITIDPREET